MADRRYKLINRGLPGVVSFPLADLTDGQIIVWNLATRKWQAADPLEMTDVTDTIATDGLCVNNTVSYKGKDTGGTCRDFVKMTGADLVAVGSTSGPTAMYGDTAFVYVDEITTVSAEDVGIYATDNDIILDANDSVRIAAADVDIYAADNSTQRMQIQSGQIDMYDDLHLQADSKLYTYTSGDVVGSYVGHNVLRAGGTATASSYLYMKSSGGTGHTHDFSITCSGGTAGTNAVGTVDFAADRYDFDNKNGVRRFIIHGSGNYVRCEAGYLMAEGNSPGNVSMYVDASSNTSTVQAFRVRNTLAATKMYIRADGNCWNVNNSYTGTSDIDLKEHVIPETDGLNVLRQINPINYKLTKRHNLRTDEDRHSGFSAQEIRVLMPEAITWVEEVREQLDGDEEENVIPAHYQMNYLRMIPAMVNGIKEVDAENDRLRRRIKSLEDRLDALEGL